MTSVSSASGDDPLTVLNVVISSPGKRGGAIRAGLQFGDALKAYCQVDTIKMAGRYDTVLAEELELGGEFETTPSRTFLRDVGNAIVGSDGNYENTVIWTELTTPRPLGTYDVAHLHNAVPLWGLLAAAIRCRIAGVPYVMTAHGISKIPDLPESMNMSTGQQFLFNQAFLKPYKWVLRNAEHLIALSESGERQLNQIVPGVPTKVVPNGVQLNVNEPDVDPVNFDLPKSRAVLLFVGKIIESKGVGDLLSALDHLETACTCIIAGPPADEEYVRQLRELPDDRVRYLGYAEQDVLKALYRRAELFVFPTRSDVFPLVTLEALAAGTPVVSTTVGGIPEQITDDTGVLVPPEQPKEIARSVDMLVRDDERRDAMSKAAVTRAKTHYSWDSVARRVADVYEDICE